MDDSTGSERGIAFKFLAGMALYFAVHVLVRVFSGVVVPVLPPIVARQLAERGGRMRTTPESAIN